jgi:hypothetical protein
MIVNISLMNVLNSLPVDKDNLNQNYLDGSGYSALEYLLLVC